MGGASVFTTRVLCLNLVKEKNAFIDIKQRQEWGKLANVSIQSSGASFGYG